MQREERITLVVGGTKFVQDPRLFTAYPDTMLGRMLSSSEELVRVNDRGEYEVVEEISTTVFRAILEFYKNGYIRCPPTVSLQELREACDYFLVPFNGDTVKSHNLSGLLHELSNDGAWSRFEYLLETLMLPLMINSAKRGNRECHIVILRDNETADWNKDYLPQGQSKFSQTIKSTGMYNLLKYNENQKIAKLVMEERGLKKVKFGVEKKSRRRPYWMPNVVYVQRPFIHMSWEKESRS